MQFDIEYVSGTCHLEDLKQLTREELAELFVQMRREGIVSGLDPTRYPIRKFKSLDEGWSCCQHMFSGVVAAKESQAALDKSNELIQKLFEEARSIKRDVRGRANKKRKKHNMPRMKTRVSPDAIITLLVDKNPKKRTAAERFSHYVDGMTVQQYCDAVGEKGLPDILWDQEHGWIMVTAEKQIGPGSTILVNANQLTPIDQEEKYEACGSMEST